MADGQRNPSMYGMVPKRLFDAMYSAPTAANNENPFITQADLDSAVGLNNELSEILANGNTTGGTDIVVSDTDLITGSGGVIQMDFGSDAYWSVSTDTGAFLTPYIYVDPSSGSLGSSIGAFVVSDVATLSTNFIQMYTALLVINHDTEVRILAPDIQATADTGDIVITATAADVNIVAGTNIELNAGGVFDLTAITTEINTRETIWTTQAAGVTALVDAFKLYSADIAAGNAAPHFETENGNIVKLFRGATIADAAGGATVDAEARTAINTLLARLRVTGGNGLIAD